MKKVISKFPRATGVIGDQTFQRVSTTVVLMLNSWSEEERGRSFDLTVDEQKILVVELSFDDKDLNAYPALEALALSQGVECSLYRTN